MNEKKKMQTARDEINVINKEYSWQFKSNLAIIYSLTAPTYSPRLSSESAEQEDALGGLANWAIVMGIVRHLAARFKINVGVLKIEATSDSSSPAWITMNTMWTHNGHARHTRTTTKRQAHRLSRSSSKIRSPIAHSKYEYCVCGRSTADGLAEGEGDYAKCRAFNNFLKLRYQILISY